MGLFRRKPRTAAQEERERQWLIQREPRNTDELIAQARSAQTPEEQQTVYWHFIVLHRRQRSSQRGIQQSYAQLRNAGFVMDDESREIRRATADHKALALDGSDANPMPALNAALYEDKDAYWAEIERLVQQDPASRPPTPQAVRDVSAFVLGQFAEVGGWEEIINKYGQDLVETIAIAYMLAVSEDWAELEIERARELMDDSLRAAQATRTRTGAEQISLDDVDNRLTVMTMGLATNAPEGATIRDYLFSQPAYQRIDEFGPLLSRIGTAMAGVKRRHAQAYEQLDTYAWKIGLGLGLLDIMGEVPHHDRWGEPAETA